MQQFLPQSPAQGSLGLKGWEGNRLPSGSCLVSTDSPRQVLGVGLALEMAGARAVAPHLPSSPQAGLIPQRQALVQPVLIDLKGHFPKFLPVSCLRIWDENKTQSLCNPTPGAGFWRPGCFPLRVCYLMGTEGEPRSHSAHSTFPGTTLGKVFRS